jgi:hypothetical protein
MHQQLKNTTLDITLLILHCDLLKCAKEQFPVPSGTWQGVSIQVVLCDYHRLRTLNENLVHTRSHIDQLQLKAQLVACMVKRRCAHCCQVRVCIQHVTAGPDDDTCCNGGNLNLATLIGCAKVRTERKRLMSVLTISASSLRSCLT